MTIQVTIDWHGTRTLQTQMNLGFGNVLSEQTLMMDKLANHVNSTKTLLGIMQSDLEEQALALVAQKNLTSSGFEELTSAGDW